MSRNADEVLDRLVTTSCAWLSRDGKGGLPDLNMFWDRDTDTAYIFYNGWVAGGYQCLRKWSGVDLLTTKCIIQAFLQGDTLDEP